MTTENPPFDLPIERVVERKGVGLGTLILLAVSWSLVAVNFWLHKKFGFPVFGVWQLDIVSVVLIYFGIASAVLVYRFSNYRAALTIDKYGVRTESYGVSHSRAWVDISDVKVFVMSSGKGSSSALLHILPRSQGAQTEAWVRVWSGGLNPWRLQTTIRNGMLRQRP